MSLCNVNLRWPEDKFANWPFKVKNISVNPAWREEQNGVKIILLTDVVQNLLTNNFFPQKNVIFTFDDLWCACAHYSSDRPSEAQVDG